MVDGRRVYWIHVFWIPSFGFASLEFFREQGVVSKGDGGVFSFVGVCRWRTFFFGWECWGSDCAGYGLGMCWICGEEVLDLSFRLVVVFVEEWCRRRRRRSSCVRVMCVRGARLRRGHLITKGGFWLSGGGGGGGGAGGLWSCFLGDEGVDDAWWIRWGKREGRAGGGGGQVGMYVCGVGAGAGIRFEFGLGFGAVFAEGIVVIRW